MLVLFGEAPDARDDAKDALDDDDCTLLEGFVFGFGLCRINLGEAFGVLKDSLSESELDENA